jgi:hypothetical protein|tara:strand:- start:8640 stop:9017 length:378 start_codon:yes stop_codon:yes gene_type:complete
MTITAQFPPFSSEDANTALEEHRAAEKLPENGNSYVDPYDTHTPLIHLPKVLSDGGSTSYYELPTHAKELRHLISAKGMSKSRGDIFKACYRLGEKDGVDTAYDLNKMLFFINDLIEMNSRGEHL